MSELIDRHVVIEALYDWAEHSATQQEEWHLRQVIGDIKSMPSVQPEPKTGRWLDSNICGLMDVVVCDQCNTFYPIAYASGGHRYCPNCGCKMEVEQDDE